MFSSATEGPGSKLVCPLPHFDEIRNTSSSTDVHGVEMNEREK
jgi:hypothetical protein